MAFLALSSVLYARSLPDIIKAVRNDPSDFSAWKEFREKSLEKGTSEKDIAKYEPILIAVYDRQAIDAATGGMVITAAILPGKTDGFHNMEVSANMEAAASYARSLCWYSQDGRKVKPENIKYMKGRVIITGCHGEVLSTCPFIDVREVDEVTQDWRKYYKKARKKDISLGRLTWLFLSRNKQVWGVGYEIKEEPMLPGQPMKRGARLALISKSSTGSFRTKF
jgi:hypothetical protein